MRIGLTGFFTLFVVMPAWAGQVQNLPEPGSLGLIAAGIAAAVIAGRYRRRK